ncbi:unnamed protein product [Arctogadus glacialis]
MRPVAQQPVTTEFTSSDLLRSAGETHRTKTEKGTFSNYRRLTGVTAPGSPSEDPCALLPGQNLSQTAEPSLVRRLAERLLITVVPSCLPEMDKAEKKCINEIIG